MNTNRLAKLYVSLTAVERLRLMHDAGRRGDAQERQRLLDAAPRRHYSMADSARLEVNLMHCATMHRAFQLGTAAEFWHAQTLAAWALEDVTDAEPLPDETRDWSCSATLAQASYAIERDGWKLFIGQCGFDESRIVVPQLAEHWMLEYMDEHATVPPDFETAAQWLLGRNEPLRAELVEPLTLITPEFIADDWHRLVGVVTAG
jgi:hypothetical protein